MPTILGPTLTTDRLILRPPVYADFEAWVAFAADPEVNRFLGGVQDRAAAWRGMATITGAWPLMGFSMFSVIERTSGRWVGRLGPWQPEGWPSTEIGWGLAREAWGKGYALEGSSAAIDWAFAELGWKEVIHCIDPQNVPSQNLAKRLGSTLRGPIQLPPPMDTWPIEVWGQTKEQWGIHRRNSVLTTGE
ncbi:GNAT family N-acetyltransferase [Oligoflexus tunisiensis]|uniref:GNAT family N-acetyltransferase n=1 Tax=Oligoflexus tunisiensis TaxID=708132 RepID=UPI000AED669E|nr:GNAT family N-acetyltransferase [Oligoflexus tunisiensis]